MQQSRYKIFSLLSGLYFRLVEFFGVCVFFVAMATLVALVSYCPEDPSFNTAIDGFVSNLLSTPGSYYSDLMVQFFGKSSYLFSFVLMSFGYQLIEYHVVSYLRIVCGIFSCILSAAFFSLVHWDNFSGVVGSISKKYLNLYGGEICETYKIYFCILIGILSLGSFLWAIRFHISTVKECFSYFKNLLMEGEEKIQELTPAVQIKRKSEEKKSSFKKKPKTPTASVSKFALPSINLLSEPKINGEKLSDSELKARSENLMKVLEDFGIKGEIVGVSPGPVVTLYELTPAAGIKSSRVIGLASDIARYMSAISARVSVIPGKNVLGIELPNVKRQTVYLREILESNAYSRSPAALPISLGKDISGDPMVVDLAKMPHLLIAGTTGSGKSVGINAMIMSLLYRLPPEKCKFIMVDPKMLELSIYDDIPHLLTPVVTDPKKAVVALKWAVKEMESRYKAMSKVGVRNIENYNAKLASLKASGEEITRRVHTGFDPETGGPVYETQKMEMNPFPYIVIIVDEMADLMLVAGKDIEVAVQRLAQMARAAGIHLIMATQRPSVDVITGTIKANFPTRISFQVSSKIDSRTILGEQGAEQLLGQGDMLYMSSGGRTTRVHCPFVSDSEVEKITNALREQGEPQYIEDVLEDDEGLSDSSLNEGTNENDPLYQEAVDLIMREGKASTSFIQRHLKIGYNRAARIIDMMENAGIVSAANHVGKREILGR
jgi:S-DNA-T family DNA segregation ATPase FtsK/SpoIIIE